MSVSKLAGPSQNPLMESFNLVTHGDIKTLSDLYEDWKKVSKRSRQTKNRRGNGGRDQFHNLKNAIQDYMRRGAKDKPQLDQDGRPDIVDAVKALFDFSEKATGLKKVEIFFRFFDESIQDWQQLNIPEDAPDGRWKSHPAYITVQAMSRIDPRMAFTTKSKEENTPFAEAAEAGASELVEVMLGELLKSLEEEHPDPEKRKKVVLDTYLSTLMQGGKTAFFLAASSLSLEVLELLLKDYPQLATIDSIKATIEKTAPDQDKEDRDDALKAFMLIVEHMNKAANDQIWDQIWQEAVKKSSLPVVHYLLNMNGENRFITSNNAEFVMMEGSKDMWAEFGREGREKLFKMEKKDLLHTAVKHLNAEIVEDIVREFPEQVAVNTGSVENPRYPIQLLKRKSLEDKKYDQIRNALLRTMIRRMSPDMGIREIRRILRKSEVEGKTLSFRDIKSLLTKEPADTICLHLSNIDTEEQSFTDYVDWLQEQDKLTDNFSGRIFKFETILKYANFPDLHTQMTKHGEDLAASLRVDHTEIRTVYEWLRNRGVEEILELSVPDRLFCPHSDADVKVCVDGGKVRVLNWRKLDLYLGNLEEKNYLQELYLYSSGNKSVHEQWKRELPTFRNLRKLHVRVVVDVLSDNRVEEVRAELQKVIDDIKIKSPQGLKRRFGKVVVEEYHWAKDTGYRTYRNLTDITNDVVGPNLASFVDKYRGTMENKGDKTRTKVALIDSGVVVVDGKAKEWSQAQTSEDKNQATSEKREPTLDDKKGPAMNGTKLQLKGKTQRSINDLARRIKGGKSFVNTGDDEEQVWWHASEPHGTQMARLICSIDPLCELYIIKVAETRGSGISANVVADAIRWAIAQDVDVISLSLVAYTDTADMSKALHEARDQDIVILSSTADEGVRDPRSVVDKTAKHDVFTIAACDKWGNPLDRSQKEGYQYRFIGQNVHVGQVPFLKSPESISGSSVATAIAAGTASLILACCRISEKCKTLDRSSKDYVSWRCPMVQKTFDKMLEGAEQKYAALENLCGKNKKLQHADFKATVNDSFQ